MTLIPRTRDKNILEQLMGLFPATAILGARQCGKTTLAKEFESNHHFDLENPADLARLAEPQLALQGLKGLIVIDEIQRAPELFPLLRYLIDTNSSQRYLLLGSASGDLLKQSSESLAGRIGYHQLGGFRLDDLGRDSYQTLWLRGGLPRSFLAPGNQESLLWRRNYISTFLERDIPQLGISIPAASLRRFWTMISHYHGQLLNASELGRSFGVSDVTIRRYLDILRGTFMVRLLMPWHSNTRKRLVKRPKLYLRDTGLLHALQNIGPFDDLSAHPRLGASWEGYALDEVIRHLGKRDDEVYFWRAHTGAELDLLFHERGRTWGVEVKYTLSPKITRSMRTAIRELELSHLWVITPEGNQYPLAKDVTVLPIGQLTGGLVTENLT
jgi:uncharacterized protein